MKSVIKLIVSFFLCTLYSDDLPGQDYPPKLLISDSGTNTVQLIYPSLVNKFYQINQQKQFWFSDSEQSLSLRRALKDVIDSAVHIGLDGSKYHYSELLNYTNSNLQIPDRSITMTIDSIFTDVAIAFFKDVYQGTNISSMVNADEVSAKYSEADNNYILHKLSEARSAILLKQAANSLEPRVPEYLLLKEKLVNELQTQHPDTINSLVTTLSLFRWIYHFRLEKFIVINIPSATLLYYESDTLKLKMKVVLGKPSTRTPRFAAYCDYLILYPYWNVPRKIAVNELLPLFKKSPALIEVMNMQVVDNKGEILDPQKLAWATFNKANFPYGFRQSTGCDNALGVIKFNLTSPFDVYMHDTNVKSAFQSSFRYYSHGCIRLEKPIELGNLLLCGRLDPDFLKSCLKDQKPVTIKLDKLIPVFVIYGTAGLNEMKNIVYYKDIYKLIK
ncbi:MAG TPA: L,D-transpeptidase family protein [Puia sp.]|nr:L,D-transpeptidase family protein [Puia sp.]